VKWIVAVMLVLFYMGVVAGETQAHEKPGWTGWARVTWETPKRDWDLVRHRHTSTGTTCEMYDDKSNIMRRVKLVSRNAGHRDCTGTVRER
jgi:hypothetical protein